MKVLVNGIRDYLALGNDFWSNLMIAEIIGIPILVLVSLIATSNII